MDLDSIFSLLFKRNLNKPIEVFIDDITETLLEIHTQIHSRELKITENKSKISIFQASLTEISKALKKSQKAQENFLSINYVKDKSYCNELFKHYKLKYKGGITSDILYSIYAEEDLLNKQCILPIGAGNSDIFINIYGKNTHLKENEFNLISSIKLPLIEVYSSITTEGFLFENIPPVYLILEFKDIRENAVYKGVNRFELRFDLKISLEKREDIIKGLIESYNNENNYCKESIKRRILLVDSLLEPFKEEIYYDIDGGIMNRNKMRKNGVCDINCVIY